MKMIGLAGAAGAGKGVSASELVDNFDGEVAKFAGPLKAMLRAFYVEQEVDPETIERKIEGDLKEVPCEFLDGKTPRYAMQTLGTDWGRDMISENLWVNCAGRKAGRISGRGKVAVFDDMRFPNEVAFVKSMGGLTIRIVAPENRRDAGSTHASESQVASLPVDYEIRNDSTIRTLRTRVALVVGAVKHGNVGGADIGFAYGGYED